MFYLIYKITNNTNGKIYIGSHKTKNPDDGYMGSGKYLKNSIKKYGLENFTKDILYVFDNPKDMYQKEAEIVNEDFLSSANTYNLKKGGNGGFDYINSNGKNLYGNNGKIGYGGENLRKSLTSERLKKQGRYEEWKKKISASLKGRPGTFTGKKHSPETIEKLKGHSRQNGNANSQFGTCWVTHPESGNKKIKVSNLEIYLDLGYNKGRVLK